MSHAEQDRRRFHRIAFDASTELSQGDSSWLVQLHDLSLKGLLVSRPSAWAPSAGQPLWARIRLSDEVQLNMQVGLARESDTLLGFVCHHIDLASISHLRRLVELNLGDSDLLERELAALGMDDAAA